jgi:hypothetical protein
MADRELHTQMLALGFPKVGFAHGLAAAKYQGNQLWNSKHSPSQFSLFMLTKHDPLLSN